MAFLILGVLLGALKLLDVAPVATWSWWIVLTPFALAIAWWSWADWSGYTKRKEMDKMDERKLARRNKNMVNLGIDPRAHERRAGRAAPAKSTRGSAADKAAKSRGARGTAPRDAVASSQMSSRMDSEMGGRSRTEPEFGESGKTTR